MGAERMVRYWLVGRKEVSRLRQRRRHGEASAVPLSVMGENQKPDPRRTGEMGSRGPKLRRRIGSGKEESRRTFLSESNSRKSHLPVQKVGNRKSTSQKPEGRSATFRVKGLFFRWFLSFFDFLFFEVFFCVCFFRFFFFFFT